MTRKQRARYLGRKEILVNCVGEERKGEILQEEKGGWKGRGQDSPNPSNFVRQKQYFSPNPRMQILAI